VAENEDTDGWNVVGTFKTTTADVKSYFIVPSNINIDNYVSCLFFTIESFQYFLSF
jgi:hypothetical protein